MSLSDLRPPVLAHNNRCLFIIAMRPPTCVVMLVTLLSKPLLLALLLEELCNILELVMLFVINDVLVWTPTTEPCHLLQV